MRSDVGTFNTWLAFHGDAYVSLLLKWAFSSYLKKSFDNGLGSNWLDKMYSSNSSTPQCPIVIVFGPDSVTNDKQYEWGGFNDRFKVARTDPKILSTYFYLSGCDPKRGQKLP